jgi:predicted nucleic acid-binding protein
MVIDASALIDIVLSTAPGAALGARLAAAGEGSLAPELLAAEAHAVLRAKEAAREYPPDVVRRARIEMDQLGVSPIRHAPLLDRAWELRANLTIADGLYVALAELAERPLLTSDLRLARAARRHTAIDVVTHDDPQP